MCMQKPAFAIDHFPRDHLRDIAKAFHPSTAPRDLPVIDLEFPGPVIVVTRERGEHFNWYHSTTDFLNAFITSYVNGWDPEEVTLLLLDNHDKGPYDPLWDRMFARLVRTKEFYEEQSRLASGKVVRFAQLALSPPGYTSIFFAKDPECTAGVGLLRAFATYVLNALNLSMRTLDVDDASDPIRITLISRRPYSTFVDHSFMGRQMANEAEVAEMLESLVLPRGRPVVVDVVDFGQYAFNRQLDIVSRTDVLIGMHGAALTHSLFLPSHAALIELRPVRNSPPMYARTSEWSGLIYESWTNEDHPKHYQEDANGDYTTISIPALRNITLSVIDRILQRPTTSDSTTTTTTTTSTSTNTSRERSRA